MRGSATDLGEAVGAEEDLVAGGELQGVGGVDGDAGVEADGAGEDAALGVDGGLVGGEAAAADQLADHGVVGGELLQRPVAQEVGAAVADVGELEVAVAGEGGRGHGGAHAPQARVAGGLVDDGGVRLPDGGGQRLGGLGGVGELAAVEGGQGRHRRRRGDLATLMAAEPVGHREHGPAAEVAVLVAGTGPTDVGSGEAAQPHVASSICPGGRFSRDGAIVGADNRRNAIGGGPVTTAAELDPAPKLGAYAHPERLVTTAWLAEHLGDDNLVVVESDEDVLLYETGHIPGAVKIDWHLDLNDPVERDYVSGEGFARLMSSKGIGRDTTVVFYGDNFNWWAAYALWVFDPVRPPRRAAAGRRPPEVGRGGPAPHHRRARPRQPTDYPVVERDDSTIRVFRDQVLDHVRYGGRLVDVRSPGEYSGELLAHARLPAGGGAARRPHPGRGQRALEAGGQRRRHLQDGRRAAGHLRG